MPHTRSIGDTNKFTWQILVLLQGKPEPGHLGNTYVLLNPAVKQLFFEHIPRLFFIKSLLKPIDISLTDLAEAWRTPNYPSQWRTDHTVYAKTYNKCRAKNGLTLKVINSIFTMFDRKLIKNLLKQRRWKVLALINLNYFRKLKHRDKPTGSLNQWSGRCGTRELEISSDGSITTTRLWPKQLNSS